MKQLDDKTAFRNVLNGTIPYAQLGREAGYSKNSARIMSYFVFRRITKSLWDAGVLTINDKPLPRGYKNIIQQKQNEV